MEQIKAQLAAKEEELGGTRAEYDQKKKEVGWGWMAELVWPRVAPHDCGCWPCAAAQ